MAENEGEHLTAGKVGRHCMQTYGGGGGGSLKQRVPVGENVGKTFSVLHKDFSELTRLVVLHEKRIENEPEFEKDCLTFCLIQMVLEASQTMLSGDAEGRDQIGRIGLSPLSCETIEIIAQVQQSIDETND